MSVNNGPLEDFTEALAEVQAENARLHRLIAQAAAALEEEAGRFLEAENDSEDDVDAVTFVDAVRHHAAEFRRKAAKIAGVRAAAARPALAHDLGGEG